MSGHGGDGADRSARSEGRFDLRAAPPELAERLRIHVDRLAGLIGPRHPGRPSALAAAEAYVARELGVGGDDVEREAYRIDAGEVANRWIERRGATKPDEVVVLGAHYDTVPGTPGADDNASAVAVLLEVARLLRALRTPRSIRFVAFACEEPPYFHVDSMGSQIHARGCRARGESVHAMVCLEMLGYFTDAHGTQRVPEEIPRALRWLFPRRGNFLASVANIRSAGVGWTFRRGFRRASTLRLKSVALPERVHAIRLSDNSSFWDQGYRALMITDTSFLRNPHYHLASDTPETLDYGRLALGALGVAGGVAALAGARWRP